MTDLAATRGAIISDCGTFRTRLWRNSHVFGRMTFIMLNPSTADGEQDDPTIRRCLAFTKREGLGCTVVVNLFTHRSSTPRSLWEGNDPSGPDAFYAIRDAIQESFTEEQTLEWSRDLGKELPFDRIVCGWGAIPTGAPPWFRGMHRDHADEVIGYAKQMGRKLWCLGKTANGSPRHPLYVHGQQPLETWP